MILLDLHRCRGLAATLFEQPEYQPRWIAQHVWSICPECLWLSVWPQEWPHVCSRPRGEMIRYGGGHYTAMCCEIWPTSKMIEVPQGVSDAIWSSLLLGSTNAVIALLSGLQPAVFGLPTSLEKYKQRRDIEEISRGKFHAG